MGKHKFDNSNKNIAEDIFNEYIYENDFQDNESSNEKLNLLVYNNLACKLEGVDSVLSSNNNTYRVACKFIQKYNKTNKKYRRRLSPYEFCGKESIVINTNDELTKLASTTLDSGVYYCQMDEKNYAKLIVKFEDLDSRYNISYTFYIIGKQWKKWKNKFYEMLDYYNDIVDKSENEYIYYTDGRPRVNVIFKPFDKVIMQEKDTLIKYIENWISNIPVYYDKYKIISKLSILIYGKPGTGKSTVTKAIAKYLGINSITSLSPDFFSPNNEENPRKRRSSRYNDYGESLGEETVYTIDDIDCVCKSREDSDEKENTETLMSLLSFLDNPPTFYYHAKNGKDYPISIVIATTNYFNRLDDAVKRYGRFDLKIEMDDFDRKQAQEMCDIYDLKLSDIVKNSHEKDFTISPSYLQALCLENVDKSLKNIK